MEKFTELGLSKELTDVLKQSGFEEPTEIQEKAIPLALAGKDISCFFLVNLSSCAAATKTPSFINATDES